MDRELNNYDCLGLSWLERRLCKGWAKLKPHVKIWIELMPFEIRWPNLVYLLDIAPNISTSLTLIEIAIVEVGR